ncbi:MAG TPA: IS256 family transposase [Syntrophorhabdaceae bacterium]|nr:IS256 family transposase [Syntrophorhabdaceae bacterium]
MELKVSVSEALALIKEVENVPAKIFEYIGINIQEAVGKFLTNLMDLELTHHLGRDKYVRKEGHTDYRNGSYSRKFCIKGIGDVELKIPRDRDGDFKTQVIPRSRQYEDRITEDLAAMYLTGISTRTLSLLSKRLIGRSISPTEISNATTELKQAIEKWRTRDLSGEKIKYLIIDGVNFHMRIKGSIEIIPILVVIGVREDNTRLVLLIQSGDKESASPWRESFKDLKTRGLDGLFVQLGIMDGIAGLEKVFKEEFPNAKVQRCQVHVARNVLAKVPQKLKQSVADDLRSIFYASSKKKADEFAVSFVNKWEKEIPSAVKSLSNSLDACLTFFSFPEEEWISLRTTNMIERLNKEFKRRTKPMEIVAGENSCYLLLAFISLKMEMSWRRNKIGKVRPNLPLYKKFTQLG